MGAPAELVAQIAAFEPPRFGVWPLNMAVVDTWLLICSQWNAVAMADGRLNWLGLKYADVRAGFELAEIKVSARTWSGVQVMERAAAAALNGYGS